MMRNGKLTGYMSIRSQASAEEIAAVEPLYQVLNQGTAQHSLFKGLVLRKGILGRLPLLPLRWRIRSAMAALCTLLLGGQFMLGSSGAELGLSALITTSTTLRVTWLLEHQIARPIENVARQALKVATGERNSVDHLNRADEVGLILRVVGQLGLMCRWLLNDVTSQVANVRSGSVTLAKGSDSLNQHTHQTVANVQHTVATMSQMTASVQANSETAAADTLSGTARGR